MWEENSGAFIKVNNKEYELVCNYKNKEAYIDNLSEGCSFYLINSSSDGCSTVFSIENAVKIRNYLNEMIEVAEDSEYFNKKKEAVNITITASINQESIKDIESVIAKLQNKINRLKITLSI